ncbi:LOW QUALITY PROTEIN: transmembrane protein 183A-like [Panthera pardus]|uniref:LOW QUALITY PROTEIN: transmembrane protein 183A-like n=1 Tax=Panthera pardus TaxID=9691 RepID=A0A9V1EW55_PANPR|nr:LOW QUALITY PROTEIN: transmembrane protein 183A-like [Panthera pardus]
MQYSPAVFGSFEVPVEQADGWINPMLGTDNSDGLEGQRVERLEDIELYREGSNEKHSSQTDRFVRTIGTIEQISMVSKRVPWTGCHQSKSRTLCIHERTVSRKKKKKSKRHKEDLDGAGGEEYLMDIWLLVASYIRPEDIVNFSLICKNAWNVTCTAAFWTRLYRRHCTLDASLPLRLRPESMEKLRCLRACVIRSLYHMYEPFAARTSKNPAIPESTPSTLKNSKCLLFWCRKIVGNRQEPMWEFNFKLKKQSPRLKSKCMGGLQPPIQYEDVHTNPDQDCCLLQVTTLNFIFIPIAMGMVFTLFTINVSTDIWHHRVRLVFQDSPVRGGQKLRCEQGVQIILDPAHSVQLWWCPNIFNVMPLGRASGLQFTRFHVTFA